MCDYSCLTFSIHEPYERGLVYNHATTIDDSFSSAHGEAVEQSDENYLALRWSHTAKFLRDFMQRKNAQAEEIRRHRASLQVLSAEERAAVAAAASLACPASPSSSASPRQAPVLFADIDGSGVNGSGSNSGKHVLFGPSRAAPLWLDAAAGGGGSGSAAAVFEDAVALDSDHIPFLESPQLLRQLPSLANTGSGAGGGGGLGPSPATSGSGAAGAGSSDGVSLPLPGSSVSVTASLDALLQSVLQRSTAVSTKLTKTYAAEKEKEDSPAESLRSPHASIKKLARGGRSSTSRLISRQSTTALHGGRSPSSGQVQGPGLEEAPAAAAAADGAATPPQQQSPSKQPSPKQQQPPKQPPFPKQPSSKQQQPSKEEQRQQQQRRGRAQGHRSSSPMNVSPVVSRAASPNGRVLRDRDFRAPLPQLPPSSSSSLPSAAAAQWPAHATSAGSPPPSRCGAPRLARGPQSRGSQAAAAQRDGGMEPHEAPVPQPQEGQPVSDLGKEQPHPPEHRHRQQSASARAASRRARLSSSGYPLPGGPSSPRGLDRDRDQALASGRRRALSHSFDGVGGARPRRRSDGMSYISTAAAVIAAGHEAAAADGSTFVAAAAASGAARRYAVRRQTGSSSGISGGGGHGGSSCVVRLPRLSHLGSKSGGGGTVTVPVIATTTTNMGKSKSLDERASGGSSQSSSGEAPGQGLAAVAAQRRAAALLQSARQQLQQQGLGGSLGDASGGDSVGGTRRLGSAPYGNSLVLPSGQSSWAKSTTARELVFVQH